MPLNRGCHNQRPSASEAHTSVISHLRFLVFNMAMPSAPGGKPSSLCQTTKIPLRLIHQKTTASAMRFTSRLHMLCPLSSSEAWPSQPPQPIVQLDCPCLEPVPRHHKKRHRNDHTCNPESVVCLGFHNSDIPTGEFCFSESRFLEKGPFSGAAPGYSLVVVDVRRVVLEVDRVAGSVYRRVDA